MKHQLSINRWMILKILSRKMEPNLVEKRKSMGWRAVRRPAHTPYCSKMARGHFGRAHPLHVLRESLLVHVHVFHNSLWLFLSCFYFHRPFSSSPSIKYRKGLNVPLYSHSFCSIGPKRYWFGPCHPQSAIDHWSVSCAWPWLIRFSCFSFRHTQNEVGRAKVAWLIERINSVCQYQRRIKKIFSIHQRILRKWTAQ